MSTAPVTTKKAAMLRYFKREEVILQGAFLVGVTSLLLLIGQFGSETRVSRSDVSSPREAQEQARTAAERR